MYLKAYANHLKALGCPSYSNHYPQCNSLSQIHSSIYFSMIDRTHMGEVLTQEMSELFDKEVNTQKESLIKASGVHASSHKPTKIVR